MRPLRRPVLITIVAVASALIAGCGQGGSTGASQTPVSGDEVLVADNDFEPASLAVAPGDTVTWTWEGRAAHNVVGDEFESDVQTDGTFTHTFDEPGTYEYQCTLHSGMTGQITVADS